MLDATKQSCSEITADRIGFHLAQIRTELKKLAKKREHKSIEFLLDPEYTTDEEPSKNRVSFVGRSMTYRVQYEKARSESVARQVATFSKWVTRYNAMRSPNLLARVPVNTALAKANRLPVVVHLTVFQEDRNGHIVQHVQYKSKHALQRSLTDDDKKKIEAFSRWHREFKRIAWVATEPKTRR